MPRKIIQIAATPDVQIIALCDDGSLWVCLSNGVTIEDWQRVADIPQHSRLPKPKTRTIEALTD